MSNPNNPAEIAGVDFSAARPAPAVLTGAGFRFVVTYLKPVRADGVPNPYELDGPTAAEYAVAGLGILRVWEIDGRTGPLGGASAGAREGTWAADRALVVGYPRGLPVFAAVDFDVQPAQLPTVLAYLEGFRGAVLTRGWEGGAYGSFALVEAAAAAGIPYLWQTAAWSNDANGHPQLSSHAHLYQRNRKYWTDVPGTDENVLCRPLPWQGGGAPATPTPAPAPAPAPAPHVPAPAPAFDVRAWRANAGDTGPVFVDLQRWAARYYSAYASFPTGFAPVYGPATVAFLRQFQARSGIRGGDGRNIGAQTAAALAAAGFRG